MLRVKTDWKSRLVNDQLNHNLTVSEEGVSISNHNLSPSPPPPPPPQKKEQGEKVRILGKQCCKKIQKNDKLSDSNSAVNIEQKHELKHSSQHALYFYFVCDF